ncbi:hypothetical protein [Dyella koreensis]|uniref:Uncharacterized protein n=1 Tax=Dyella koreensis TaxID=311235 RepID=A0ABW8K642_9GAMM
MERKRVTRGWSGHEFVDKRRGTRGAPVPVYPPSHLDRLLNDLQGNSLLMMEDEGLSRLGGERLRHIRANALAQAAAAHNAEDALRCVMQLQVSAGWLDTSVGRIIRDHVFQLREETARWRYLAEHAALYLTHPRLAELRARGWLAESFAKDEYPGY